MFDFDFHAPTNIKFGKGKIKELSSAIKQYGANVLLVYGGGSIKRNGIYDDVIRELYDFNVFELSGVKPNPRITTVRDGVNICRDNDIDIVVAVGGGSSIDCAKAIAAGTFYNGDPWDLVNDWSKVTKALPIVTILTLAATGSEMNGGAVISNLEINEKKAIVSRLLIPKVTIEDPTYTFSLPPIQTGAGIADIMSHVMENYFQKDKGTYIQDRMAEAMLKTCLHYGPIVIEEPDNLEARSNIMWTSTLALNGLIGSGKTGAWSCHGIEHQLSAYYDITHGIGLAIITPNWMRKVLNDDTVDKFCEFAVNVMGINIIEDKYKLANKGIDSLEQFFIDLGIPMKLTALGLDDSKFELMASNSIDKYSQFAYVPLTKQDVIDILENSL